MSEWTPGPWRVEGSVYEHMTAEIVAHRGIAQVWASNTAMADARLMAAAPDLWTLSRALESALKEYSNSGFSGLSWNRVMACRKKLAASVTLSAATLNHDDAVAFVENKRSFAHELYGALKFIIAFYEPGQTHLDTDAWKNAETIARQLLARGWPPEFEDNSALAAATRPLTPEQKD